MGKRISLPVMKSVSLGEAEIMLHDYSVADTNIEKIEAEILLRCTEIRAEYQDALDSWSASKASAEKTLQVYAELNKDNLFKNRKSLPMLHGVIGFRTGTPKLGLEKGFNWKSVTELLKAHGNGSFVRTTEEPAKDELLARREEPEVLELMGKCKIVVAQDEKFYIEIKKENGSN